MLRRTMAWPSRPSRLISRTRPLARSSNIRKRRSASNSSLRPAPDSNGVLVQADAAALNQVLDNLLSNAIKFSPPGKQIRVTVCSPGARYVECQVQDEGPGFNENDKTRMFRRYGRLSARPTGGEPSTGLGLSIVKKLVLAMHGELACESTQGGGATFAFRLPRAATSH